MYQYEIECTSGIYVKSKDSWASRGYCRRFIRNYADVASPLYELIKKDTPWRWGDEEKNCVRPHQGGANIISHAKDA
jgi:hypothetical protein